MPETRELWNLFTMQKYYEREPFDGMYEPDGRDVQDPAVSRHVFGDGTGLTYPEGRKFAVCLTHDIDDIYPPMSHKLMSTAYGIKGLRPAGLANFWFPVRLGSDHSPYRNFRHIMDIEASYDAKSSFYFIATDRDIKRFRYNVEVLESDIGTIADRGWEVGLHGGYYAFDDPVEILAEKLRIERILGRPIIGYRNHYLMFKLPETWDHLAAAGFKYDATIGINNVAGFMNGTCHPFKPYDLKGQRWMDILELPMAIMDGGLFWEKKSLASAFAESRRVIDRIAGCGGVATLLWHNSSFNCPFRADMEKLYRKLLAYCQEKGAWITSGAEIYKWSESQGDAATWRRIRDSFAPYAGRASVFSAGLPGRRPGMDHAIDTRVTGEQ